MPDTSITTLAMLSIMLKELYGLSSINDLHPAPGGYTTKNFFFSDKANHYFLKRYNTTETGKMHNIAMAHERFADHGLPVITPIHDIHGEVAFFLDEAWWGLFPFIDGQTKTSTELTGNLVANLGSMLAKVHRVGTTCKKDDMLSMELWNKAIFTSDKLALEYIHEHTQKKYEAGAIAAENLRLQSTFIEAHPLSTVDPQPKNTCLIHGDFTHNNVFFRTDGSVEWIYDLDKACLAPRAYELARSLLITCFDHSWDETSFTLADAFLRAYLSEFPMSFEEFSSGFRIYVTHFMHMTWLEKKVILYKSERHEPFIYASNRRLKHLLNEFETLPKKLYPNMH